MRKDNSCLEIGRQPKRIRQPVDEGRSDDVSSSPSKIEGDDAPDTGRCASDDSRLAIEQGHVLLIDIE
jgi:hypothetical protein